MIRKTKPCPRCGKDVTEAAGLYRCETCGPFAQNWRGGRAMTTNTARNPDAFGTGLAASGSRAMALIVDEDDQMTGQATRLRPGLERREIDFD